MLNSAGIGGGISRREEDGWVGALIGPRASGYEADVVCCVLLVAATFRDVEGDELSQLDFISKSMPIQTHAVKQINTTISIM